MKTLFKRILPLIALLGVLIAWMARGPDFPVEWTREVPSSTSTAELDPALRDPRNWPVFHHALKSVALFEKDRPVAENDRVAPGMIAVFTIEPKGKEWKRFVIRSEVLEVDPGRAIRFRMLDESTGKTTRILDDFEWWIGVRPASEVEHGKGRESFVFGGARARTKTGRARFFGRFAPKVLMNQLYQIDLVRLANYEENKTARAQGQAPIYR